MIKLTTKEEHKLIYFIKDWLKVHGYSQKDLATKLNITSSRTAEIMKKINEIYKKGGYFNVAKKLIEIEQQWIRDPNKNILNNSQEDIQLDNSAHNKSKTITRSYSQLDIDYKVDIDLLMDRMEKDFKG